MGRKYTNFLNSNDQDGFKALPENKDFAKMLKDADEYKINVRETNYELAKLLRDLGKIGLRTFEDIEQAFLQQQEEQALGVSPR